VTEPLTRRCVALDAAKLRVFLVDTLRLWHVDGHVIAAESPAIAEVIAANGTRIWIEPATADMPFRWLARWRGAGEPAGSDRERHPRPCSSLVGVLSAMRLALNVDRGSPIRVTTQGGER
jgi:hypothetical protein